MWHLERGFQVLLIRRENLARFGKMCYIRVMKRTEYDISIVINGLRIEKVIIDPHYKERHSDVINDEIILKLVETLNGSYYDFVDEKSPFRYFVKDDVELDNKFYRLIWLIEEGELYIGVINAFRSSK